MLTCSRWQSQRWCLAGIIHWASCIIFLQHANMVTLLISTKNKEQQRPMGMSLVFWDNLEFWLNDGARVKVRGSTKSAGFILMTQWMSIQNCMVIHRLVVLSGLVWTSYKLLMELINTKWRKDLKWKLFCQLINWIFMWKRKKAKLDSRALSVQYVLFSLARCSLYRCRR